MDPTIEPVTGHQLTTTNHQPQPRNRRKGQAVVEVSLLSLLLGLFLAGAVDFGRAFYTSIVVTNMAGEGAIYAAMYPDYDQVDASCAIVQPIPIARTIQERARRVAKDRGLVIERGDQNLAQITVTTEGNGTSCRVRCTNRTVTVSITYRLDDLFLPGFLGINNISITKTASQVIQRDVLRNATCSDDDDDDD